MEEKPDDIIIKPEQKTCKYCKQEINLQAKICCHCHKRQSLIINIIQYFLQSFTIIFLIVALVQAFTSYEQLQESKHKRIEAEEVLKNATTISKRAEKRASLAFSTASTSSSKAMFVNKQLDVSNARINKTEKGFVKRFGDIQGNIQNVKNDLSSQLEILTKRNYLTALADKAISEGDRNAYYKLLEIYYKKSDQAAAAEIFKIKAFYGSLSRIPEHEEYDKKTTESLIEDLQKNSGWRMRGRAAEALGNRKEKRVLEALIKSIENEPNLNVYRSSCDSFSTLTGYPYEDVLDDESLIMDWWSKNKDRVEKDFK
ncbi:MAG: HEAT repeat domain-containing protein [Nitrospirota bacterium]